MTSSPRLVADPCPWIRRGLFAVFALTVCGLERSSAADSAILKSEFLNDPSPTPQCHASTIVETPLGLVAAWFGGTREKHPDVGIWVTHEQNGAWTEPKEVANGVQPDGTRLPCWNPVLFQVEPSRLVLFYKIGPSPDTWWGMLRESSDSGRTWSEGKRLPDGILGPIKNKPIRLPNGDILSPTSTEHAGWRVHFERSSDGGRTWTASSPVNDGKPGVIQPSILVRKDGTMQALGRSQVGWIYTTKSRDNGQTWSKLEFLPLPNPNSGTDAVTLRDGRHLLVYNHTAKGRSPLNVAISEDGITWNAGLVLENEPGEHSYPAVIQTQDGLVHITYTWKRQKIRHVVLNPEKLCPRPIANGEWPNDMTH